MAGVVHIAPVGRVTVASRTWRRGPQRHVTVMVKATFAFVPDGLMAPTTPLPVFTSELHNDHNPTASVCATNETAPFLRKADVVFRGAAVAPGGTPVQKLTTRLALARGSEVLFDKRLEIFGDRKKDPSGEVSAAEPFTRMPLVYDRAYGGIGNAQNPLGVGLGPSADGRIKLPNVENPSGANQVEPAGYAPISVSWAARKKLLGGRARAELDPPDAEIPEDFDDSYFQSAPPDQRIGFLQGDEMLMLKHLTPSAPAMMTTLPGARGQAQASIAGQAPFSVELVADTLFVDGDEGRCAVIWRGHFPVPDDAEVRCSLGVGLRGQAVVFTDASGSGADVPEAARGGPVFAGAAAGPGGSTPPRSPSERPAAPANQALGGTMIIEPESEPMPPQAAKNMGTMVLEVPGAAPADDGPNRHATMLLEPEAAAPVAPALPKPPPGIPRAPTPPPPPPGPPPAPAQPTPPPADHPLAGTMVLDGGPPAGNEASPLPFRTSDRPAAPRRSEPPAALPGAPWAKAAGAEPPKVTPVDPAIRSTMGEEPPETQRLDIPRLAGQTPGEAKAEAVPPAAAPPAAPVALGPPNVVKLDEPPKAEPAPEPQPEAAPPAEPKAQPPAEPPPEPKRRAGKPAMKTSLYKKFGKS